MGWVSLLEDTLEKIQDNIRLAETALKDKDDFVEANRRASLKALNDAQVILVRAWKHLELATSPELNLAHEIESLRSQIKELENKLALAQQKTKKAEYEAANNYAILQDANREILALRKKNRKLEKDFEKIAKSNFASTIGAFSSDGMIKKYKPKE